jgi:hypothetical protein
MTSKSWTKVSTMLSEMLSETIDKQKVDTVMQNWNNRKNDICKAFNSATTSRPKRDPNAPKKWSTNYILFCSEQRKNIKQTHPEMSNDDITRKLGELWQNLSDKDKKKYQEASQRDKERYQQEMQNYVPPADANVNGQQKTRTRGGKTEREGPKRPLTAYMFFCQENRPQIKSENPNINNREITSELGKKWKSLSDKERAPYEEKQNADKLRYENEKTNQSRTTTATPAHTTPAHTTPAHTTPTHTTPAHTTPAKTQPTPATTENNSKKSRTKTTETTQPENKTAKKPATNEKTPGYENFVREQADELASDHPDWNGRKVQTEISKRWRNLTESERQQYEDDANEQELVSEVELEDE